MEELSLGIYVPSYKRSHAILTGKLLEPCTYVVRKSEWQAYSDAVESFGCCVWAVDDSLVDSAMKVVWHIIRNAKEDVVFIADDDIRDFLYRSDKSVRMNGDKETIGAEIERIAQILADLGLGYACNDATAVPYGYDGEFAFKGTSGSMKWVNRRAFKAKPDPNVPYNFDLDIVMQELLGNRIIVKPRYICGYDKGDVNAGGDNDDKTIKARKESVQEMKRKWGRHFAYNWKNNRPRIVVER